MDSKNDTLIEASDVEGLKVLGGFISSLLQSKDQEIYTDSPHNDTANFFQKLGLDDSAANSVKESILLLNHATRAASLLVRGISDSLAHLTKQTKLYKTSGISMTSIEALPDEIISLVAEQVYELLGQRKVIDFSHVCRRWRCITLSLPKLWCSPVAYDRELTQMLLSRSKAAPLDLRLLRQPQEDIPMPTMDFLDDVIPHFGRCRSFELHLERDSGVEGIVGFMECVGNMCNQLKAPVLDSLSILCNTFDDEENILISMDERSHFYASWDMPQLRSLHVTNFIPQPMFGNSLRSLRVEFTTDFGPEIWDIQLLLDFLRSVPQLEVLSIRMLISGFLLGDSSPEPLIFEALKALTLDIAFDDGDELEVLSRILSSIITPNVTELTVGADVRAWQDIHDWLDRVFSDTNDRFIHIERLNIEVRRFVNEQCRIDDFFPAIPNLSHLSIKTVRGDEGAELWDLSDLATQMPPLRTLQQNGPNFCFSDAWSIVSAMKKGEHWTSWKGLKCVDVLPLK